MATAIGEILGFAVGVAISPVPIIAVILMLFSPRAGRNSVSFLVGWLAGLTGIAVAVLALGIESGAGSDANGGGTVEIVVGALFLVLAIRQWRNRPAPGAAPELPAWMASIDDLGALGAFGLGVLVTVPNPKNLGLTVAAAATIGGAGLGPGQEVVVTAVYVGIASATIIAPVAGYLLARSRVEPALEALEAWLTVNHATVMTVLFAVLGAKVLGAGIAGVS